MTKNLHLQTILAHLAEHGGIKDPYAASHIPIYQTATFDLAEQHGDKHYGYTRSENPTREALENVFAIAERGIATVCTHTGIGAVALVFETILKTGSHVLAEEDIYGGTYRLLDVYKQKFNITVHYKDLTNHALVEETLNNNPISLVICESPTNPGLKIIDLKIIATLAHKYNTILAVDNSVATFASQQPLSLGADISFSSTTKYIAGNGSVIAGAVTSKDPELAKKIAFTANAFGRSQNPFDVFCVSLGVPTLPLRMKAHEQSAFIIAKYLEKHPNAALVRFPGLPSHPGHQIAKLQMSIMPAIITFDTQTEEQALNFIKKAKLFKKKYSFGTPDSRANHPATMSHASTPNNVLKNIGINTHTIRLSIGLEHPDDLLSDLEQALS
ncbi:MAG: aminotransferase class I/II-fold pyridoxal phosphate-dependent enzyme [bacterium]